MSATNYTDAEKMEIADIVLAYEDKLRAEECEPEEPANLWMDLADWFDEQDDK